MDGLLRHGAPGREDMDVRMLGGGRPFALEVQNARKCTHSEPFFREVEALLQQVGPCAPPLHPAAPRYCSRVCLSFWPALGPDCLLSCRKLGPPGRSIVCQSRATCMYQW